MNKFSDFRGAKIVYYLVKELKEISVKKLMYLMYIYETISGIDLDYSLYHFGPKSIRVNWFINTAKSLNWIKEYYDKFLKLIPLSPEIEPLENEDKEILDIVKHYGRFSTSELSIIATALFMKREFGSSEEEIFESIKSLKPNKEPFLIRKLIDEANQIISL